MFDLSPLFNRLLPADPSSAAVVLIAIGALAVAFMALRVVAIILSQRGRR